MNTPVKAVEATSPAQNADKTTDHKETKDSTPEKKPEVTNPAPASVK